MEKRFDLPYNWCKGAHTRHIRQKNGLWTIAQEFAGPMKGLRVLDAGCGDGWYTAKMLSAGADAVGIDYSARGIKHAEAIVNGAEFKVASIADIPYADKSFDVVFSFQVIEHLPISQVDAAVRELARITKKEGLMIISVPSVRRKMSAAHFQHFSEQSLRDAFEKYVEVVDVIGQDRRTPVLWAIERLLQNRWYTLESLAYKFNNSVYLNRFNKTDALHGDNLIIVAHPRA